MTKIINKIKLYHTNWVDTIIIKENRIKRESYNQDDGECIFIDNFLNIIWKNSINELFYKVDTDNYYLINNNNLLQTSNNILDYNKFYVLNIELFVNNQIVHCIIDMLLNKVYNKINLEYVGNINIIDNNTIIINNNEYIYINLKYYCKNDIIKEFKIININNQLYFLKNNSEICIKNYDFINKYEYISYKNILKINNSYYKTNDTYYYELINKTYLIEEYTAKNCNNSIKNIYLKNNKLLDKRIIEYYKNIDINIVLIDNIENKDNNIIYYDIDFIYTDNLPNNIFIEEFDYTMNLSKQSVDKELFSGVKTKENSMNLSKQSVDKELFSEVKTKENSMNLSVDKELFSEVLTKENSMNLSKQSVDKELFSEVKTKENSMNLSVDKELFSEVLTKENSMNLSVDKELFSGVKTKENSNKYWIYQLNEKYINKELLINKWEKINNNIQLFDDKSLVYNDKLLDRIPKVLHFIWIGNNNIPNIYLKYIQSWIKYHPDYTYCFWNDDNIPKLINQNLYDSTNIYAMKADILRYEILYFYGGIYIDCDFLCLKNIDNLLDNIDGFSGWESDKYIAIGLMGFKKWDDFLFKIIINLPHSILNNNSIPEKSGPIYFTEQWNKYIKKSTKYISYEPSFFYSYTFQDKMNNKKYINYNTIECSDKFVVNHTNSYAIHMWGYSWKENILTINTKNNNFKYISYLLNIINIIDSKDDNKINNKIDFSINHFKHNIFYKKSNDISLKPKIVHIMGMFFTGGIERYLYYIDKYGNHNKYDYYILYINDCKHYYNIKNIKMISYDWNHTLLNQYLHLISPDLIIDHYSIYLEDNSIVYNNINRNNILYFVHSAICYKRNIKILNIKKAIHLYKEYNNEESWNKIKNNYYITLGIELNNINSNNVKHNNVKHNKLNINIIGRITEEKIPILFLEKLCILSKKMKNIVINIYGEKDIKFNKDYIDKFNVLIKKSNIKVHDFVEPEYIYKIYNKTDILLISSSYETGSFTCLEAFSYGIPVIARNVYGLKYLIENNISGYLFNTDEEILNKLNQINSDKNDILLSIEKKNKIIEISKKYNIIDKIKDFEYIMDENLKSKNLVIITSVINCCNNPLSYYNIRSIFDINERYRQTLKTISTIREKIPNVEILFCECSDLSENKIIENELQDIVEYYYNFYNINTIKDKVISKYKGLGEAYILLESINIIQNIINKNIYINIFKISGRYYLNSNFNYENFNNEYNQFTHWDNNTSSYCTLIYKINYKSLLDFEYSLYKSLDELEKGNSIEQCMFKNFNNNIKIINKFNVSGFLATEGYLFSI